MPETPDQSAKRSAVAYTRDRAVRLLAGREHGRKELVQKLVTRDLDPDIVGVVVERLVEQGLQSDLRFVEAYTRSRARKGFGEIGIRMELGHRGVDAAVVEQGMLDADCDWLQVAIDALARKFRGDTASKPEQAGRMRRFLFGRGFDSDLAGDAIQAFTASPQR